MAVLFAPQQYVVVVLHCAVVLFPARKVLALWGLLHVVVCPQTCRLSFSSPLCQQAEICYYYAQCCLRAYMRFLHCHAVLLMLLLHRGKRPSKSNVCIAAYYYVDGQTALMLFCARWVQLQS